MKVLITGGQGYVGRNLDRLFKENGKYEVYAPSRLKMDLTDPTLTGKVMKNFNPNVVIHTAIKGGYRTDTDGWEIVKANVEMYENLMRVVPYDTTVIILGSGAEFDRRRDMMGVSEEELDYSFPIDPYGVSKNIIARQALQYKHSLHYLRLFGCFNYDEEDNRFIKTSILNVKEGKPIEIHQNKWMDFFYMDDLFTVIHNLLTKGGPKHMNLVYESKISLMTIADFIMEKMKKGTVKVLNPNMGLSYTGSGSKLGYMNLDLIRFRDGLNRTIEALS